MADTRFNRDRREYYQKNKERISERRKQRLLTDPEFRIKRNLESKVRRQQRYLEVIEILGGKCVRCGFDDWRALEINHKQGCPRIENGNRKDWDYLKKDYDYSLVELLCGNCHNIETWGIQKDLYGKNENNRSIYKIIKDDLHS